LRILNVSAQKPDGTGSGTFLAQTVASQVALGHETAVICGIDDGYQTSALPGQTAVFPVRFMTPELPFHVCGMSDEMPYAATRYRDLTPAMEMRFETAFVAALERALADFAPDVVLCHHLYLLSSIVREHIKGIPVAVICHSTDLRQMAMHDLERPRIISAMRRTDAVFCLHRTQAEEVVRVYGIDPLRVHVTGTGYNSCVFNQEGPRVPRQAGRICFVGKVSFKKGVESLLSAMDLISPAAIDGRSLELVLVGGHDPASQDYRRIAAKVGAATAWPVRMAGRVPTEELVRIYRSSDVFVLPSFYEGLPLVGIEALACGDKVVMTALPGVREGMGDVLPGNPIHWVEPPAMLDVDTPDPGSLPAFERRLADAIVNALLAPQPSFDVTHASWDKVVSRMLACLKEADIA
jgi:glycosyltransferase involved in cell wall biosynthesis